MTPEQHDLRRLHRAIADMNDEDQQQVQRAAHMLRNIIETHGMHGVIALSLVGAEIAAREG